LRLEIGADNTASTLSVALQPIFGVAVNWPETPAANSVSTSGHRHAKDQKTRSVSVGQPPVAMAPRSGVGYLQRPRSPTQPPSWRIPSALCIPRARDRSETALIATPRDPPTPIDSATLRNPVCRNCRGGARRSQTDRGPPRGRPNGDAREKRTVHVQAQPGFSGASGVETLIGTDQKSPLSRERSGGNSNGQRDECHAQRGI
jgi:hypothetical protein